MGTSIGGGKSNFRNFFLGAQYDFAIGGSITFGAHYGKRQKISGLDYRDFEFGETVFSGDREKRKYTDWDLGFFIGLQADSRIFAFLFQ